MIRASAVALSVPALLLAAACAPAPDAALNPRSADTCFMSDRVVNFRVGPSPSIYVKALGGDVYEMQTTSSCPGIESANTLAFTPLVGSSSRTCVSDSLSVDVAVAGASSNRCRARVVRKLSEEEVAALPSRYRP
jgi:hypothetical protein